MINDFIAIIAKKALNMIKKRFSQAEKPNRKMTCKKLPLYMSKPLVKRVKINKDVAYI